MPGVVKVEIQGSQIGRSLSAYTTICAAWDSYHSHGNLGACSWQGRCWFERPSAQLLLQKGQSISVLQLHLYISADWCIRFVWCLIAAREVRGMRMQGAERPKPVRLASGPEWPAFCPPHS